MKTSKTGELATQNSEKECCSETETEGDAHLSDWRSNASSSERSKSLCVAGDLNDDLPLISLLQSRKSSPRKKTAHAVTHKASSKPNEDSAKCLSKAASDQQTALGRKRVRIILSDDEDEAHDEMNCSQERLNSSPVEDVATCDERGSIDSLS